ncbi:response regulator [Paenibacillus antri]|uniref:Response regulator n=1 Tax=Paenibacillus antri TaxID=2582848 RepID=A0A5R9GEV9_9BACL|nr:response regulator [Paenibacillus antri]TLS53689.1 response regulator [Paenibacillus antri]
MFRVMIVEDEMLVRLGLKNSVDWKKFDMEVVADFPDGQAAWEYYQREKPDVVITDIRMPKMDGMELIANVRGRDKSTRLVVLSCLEEFELARKAMTYGVSSYILKLTMTEEEIETVLEGVRRELLEQGGRGTSEEGRLPSQNKDLLKEQMLKDFLFYNIFSADEFESFALRHGLRLSPVRLVACLMEVDRYPRLKEKFRDEHGHLIKMTLLNILNEIVAVHKRGEAFHIDETRYAIVLSFEDMHSEQAIVQETRGLLLHVQEVIRTYFNGSVSFGISGIQNGYKSLPKLYAEASRALEHKFLSGPGQLHDGRGAPDPTPARETLSALRAAPALRALLSPMKQKEYDHYMDSFDGALGEDRKSIEILLFQFVQWVSTNVYDDNQNELTLLVSVTDKLENSDNLPDMLEQTLIYLSDIAEKARSQLNMSGEITKALQYIKRHYTENISLQSVADHVGLSLSYLSNLFKKELQISFVDYLNRYRIERAKELLIGTQLKSYDIAVQVGFSPEYTYFSKVFKKVTGLNPNEYRKQWVAGARGDA